MRTSLLGIFEINWEGVSLLSLCYCC